jgi:hypothetical protein
MRPAKIPADLSRLTVEEPYSEPSVTYSVVRFTGRAYQCQATELVVLSRQFLANFRAPQDDVPLQK